MKMQILLYDDFEALDVFGPVEVFSKCEDLEMCFCSMTGGPIRSTQGFAVQTEHIEFCSPADVLFLPGGMGARTLVEDLDFLKKLHHYTNLAAQCLSVCTGSALLAKCGVLNGKSATTNKRSYTWATSQSHEVHWIAKARWVVDGKFYTSSGVSAGTDMALGFISDTFGRKKAEEIAHRIEYIWNDDPNHDLFEVH